jgi:hypothetical protein
LKQLRIEYQHDARLNASLSDIKIRLYPQKQFCQICGQRTNLLKTDCKSCYSFGLGKFTLISGSSFCPTHKYFASQSNQIIKYLPELVMIIVDKNHRIAFDLVVRIGKLRYDEHRQLEEIQNYLKCSSAKINLPISTIGMIAKRFLLFCRLLHEKYEARICDDIKANGGYFLHFDGSTEKKCDKCNLLILDSISGHLLESIMIDSENYQTVKKALEKVHSRYGDPLATISDLKSGFLRACKDVFGVMIIHIFCHYHFLKTFKNDFVPHHQLIKIHLGQKLKLKSAIKEQLKTIKQIKTKPVPHILSSIEEIENYWTDTTDTLNTYRHVLLWILMFKQDSSGKGVPFDLPFLDFYNRFMNGKKLIDKIFEKGPPIYRLKYYKRGFNTVVEKLKKGGDEAQKFRKSIRRLEYLKKWFNKLRGALFLEAKTDDPDSMLAPLSKRYHLTEEEAKAIPKRLTDYIQELNDELSHCKNPDKISVVERFRKQLEKYQKNLYVPTLTSNIHSSEMRLIPPRTNNCMECFFRLVKSLIRRCTGRSKLSKEFGSIGALLPFYLSMKNHHIFCSIFNDERKLSEEFSKLFSKHWDAPTNIISLQVKSNDDNFRHANVLQA